MHRRIVHGGLVAALTLTLGACRSSRVEDRRPDAAPAECVAALDTSPPAARPAEARMEPITSSAERERTTSPDGSGDAAEAPAEAAATVAAPADGDPGAHCGESPERLAARDNMRRMAEEHARLAEDLAAIRADLLARARDVAASGDTAGVSAVAAELARRNAERPGAATVDAGWIEALLHEAAFWGALCRTLEGPTVECDRLERPGDGALCESVARIVGLAIRRPDHLSPGSAFGAAFGWNLDRLQDERVWRVVRRGEPEAACNVIDRDRPRDDWPGPLCHAVAAHDLSRCAGIADETRRRTCAALAHAILGPGAAAGDAPGAAGTFLRERIAPSGPPASCDDALTAVLEERIDSTGLFRLRPLVLPGIETERGLAPAP